MEFDIKKQKIFEVFDGHRLAVISTVAPGGMPEAALIGFGYIPQTLELLFGTFTSFRKYKNVKQNSAVAFVIGWEKSVTVQYEGQAHELKGDELKMAQEQYLGKHPTAKKYLHHSEERLFKVTPTWIRYTNLASNPEEILEIRF